jgi:PAS domain S-box-containing protein
VSDDVLARLIAGERVANQEARLHCKDGSIKHVVIDSSALWEDGEFVHSRCFTRDITPAHEAMTALHESERRLRVAQEAAHGGIFEHDFATRSTYWSPELAALYGSPPVGGDGGDLSTWFQMIHPDDRRRVGEGMRAALRDGEYVQDFRVVWPDGSIHWLHVRAGIVADGDGRPLRMLGVQLDVTESTRTEESRALLASIVESSDDAMVTKSLTGIITSWNRGAERIFGYTSEEMIGQSILRLIPSDRRSEEQEILARLCRGERIEHYETVRLTKEGRAIDVSITVSPVRAASGEIIGASKVARDVTERRAIERLLRANEMALREADRRKDEFLAMLSHELRNPLAPIRNAVSLLAEKPAPNMLDGIHDMLDRQVGQMSRLVDDLLDVSRISRGVIPIAKQPLDLAEIVEMAVETARPLVTQRGHALSVTLPEHPIGIDGDRARLVQVIGNLLTNAAKFTPPGGRISLAAQMQGDDVSIVVRDDGIGIEPEAIDRVFDLFVQENTTLARDQGGLGIGLTLVRDLVRLHGGKVDLASRGRGTGTEVHVRLPTSKRAVAAGHTRGRREDGLAHSGLRILIAEDHRDTADSLRLLLVRQGHEVRLARDGRAAVSAFREFAPSVALLDIGLPELNGYEVARAIRADESGDRALLIAISGYGRDENKRAALEAGFDHHLTKPVDVRRLAQLFPS